MVQAVRILFALVVGVVLCSSVVGQQPGSIVRPVGGKGKTPLNPNGDKHSSKAATGFKKNDLAESEILYKSIAPAITEPTGDLRRGASGSFSDLIRSTDGTGFYTFNDGTNLLFRLRVGGIVSGSKGYSVLIDTDHKFGATGSQPDPNFIEANDGTNGNPGFELEIVLETNFRVAMYDIDGTTKPTLLNAYSVETHSQISTALSTQSGDPDFFYDFYVPIDVLGILPTTPIRMAATTVTSAGSAIGGSLSDIYGVSDKITRNGWETVIAAQSAFTLTDISETGFGTLSTCTQAPILFAPIKPGENLSLSGSWRYLDTSKPQIAVIYLFKNDEMIADIVTNTGTMWSIGGIHVEDGDVFYAKAEAPGETMCLPSPSVRARNCQANNSTPTTELQVSCITKKGISGTRTHNASVRLYRVTSNAEILVADDNSTAYKITYPTPTTWHYDGQYGGGSDPCTSAQNDITDGYYEVTAELPGFCESSPISACLNLVASTIPVINEKSVYEGVVQLSGKAIANSMVRLSLNGYTIASMTAANGQWRFDDIVVIKGDTLAVTAQVNNQCISAAAIRKVACYTSAPIMNTDGNKKILSGINVNGSSAEAPGTTVFVYENGFQVATSIVATDGTWTTEYPAVAGKDYYAVQKGNDCDTSEHSLTARALLSTIPCPSITGTYNEASTSVRGSFSPAFTGEVRLYQDDILIGTQSLVAATSWNIPVNTTHLNKLYPGANIYATSQVAGTAENRKCLNAKTISCTNPPAPSLGYDTVVISIGEKANIGVTSTKTGVLYSLVEDVNSEDYTISEFSTGSNVQLVSDVFADAGTYEMVVKATSLSGSGCESAKPVTIHVFALLPVTLLDFSGKNIGNNNELQWNVSQEKNFSHYVVERSADGIIYQSIGVVKSSGKSKYQFEDSEGRSARNFYRLLMVDKDGKKKLSKTIVIEGSSKTVLKVVPNPFKSNLNITFSTETVGRIEVVLYDVSGKVIRSESTRVHSGSNNIGLNGLDTVRPGLYVLRIIQNNKDVFQQKLIK